MALHAYSTRTARGCEGTPLHLCISIPLSILCIITTSFSTLLPPAVAFPLPRLHCSSSTGVIPMSDPWFPPPIAPEERNSPIVPTHDQVRDTCVLPPPLCLPLYLTFPFQLTVLFAVGHPLQPFFPLFYLSILKTNG